MSGEAKTVSELCREALELRDKATLEGPLSAVEGSLVTNLVRVIHSNGFEHRGQVYADLNDEWTLNELTDSEYDKRVKTGSALAASMTFNHENIKQIAERCLDLEEEVEGYRSGNLPTWKSEYDLIKSVCDEVDKNNEELRAENIRLRALVANPNLEEWYLKSENLRMVCIRLARAKTIEKRDQVASKCKHLFSDVKDILRGDEALKGGQSG